MAVQVITQNYEWAHGQTPRGRGWWAFATNPHANHSSIFFVDGCQLYRDARKIAAAHFAARGVHTIYVQS